MEQSLELRHFMPKLQRIKERALTDIGPDLVVIGASARCRLYHRVFD